MKLKTIGNAILALLVVIFISIVAGIGGSFTKSEILFITLLLLQLAVISFILVCLWTFISKDMKKFKEYLVTVLVFIIMFTMGIGLELNINYAPNQLYNKGNNLIKAHDNLKDTKLGIYNPVAMFLATSYLKKSINLKSDYNKPRIELAKYYLYKKEYDKVLLQCLYIKPKMQAEISKVLKLEAVAYVLSDNINLGKKSFTELQKIHNNDNSIKWLIEKYDDLNLSDLEEIFFESYYEFFINNFTSVQLMDN